MTVMWSTTRGNRDPSTSFWYFVGENMKKKISAAKNYSIKVIYSIVPLSPVSSQFLVSI